ncbi:hypothetical protein Poli38472_014462 [Pythium oligandrum]|uniref:Uncharacterized protein n=1 Tax=Pythium oligandrum TaxID=41045 RepID=A0A8K1CDQ5_PYTOL|nr:hypothetical protein Poli38472_014462 [Pythium oligandrum]|eukprot:TMW61001.1 hypothetical protein Poli38472_014462 [Pythium oligandrum]
MRGASGSRGAGKDAALTLGVKGRLSNQEMELLKHKLAQAVAYDHVPEDKIKERQSKATSKPMTRVYHKVDEPTEERSQRVRPSRKTLASIEYEKKFTEGSYDALVCRPAPRGIDPKAKSVLQDEYITKPRHVSSIPRDLASEDSPEIREMESKTGKRVGPVPIPQVFII